ncbi:MAG TPA: carbohydrate ABC transporter substrate-binding protein [Bacilli bacterium]|nr:carbohydrate ABC transporter substrate-binding protein [Bacilli bacterium]
MRKYLKEFVVLMLTVLTLVACGNDNTSSKEVVELTLFSTITNEVEQAALNDVVAQFEEENSDIKIDVNLPTTEYESMLRVKMAANDMPDLFDTHGWAVNRYGEYTMDLRDMDWVADLDPALESIFTDEDGKVYAYPINQAKDGLTYNKSLLEDLGIDVPTTFDEFIDVLKQIRDTTDGEVTPLWFEGSDRYALGYFFDLMSTQLLITAEDHDYSAELLDGSFNWDNYTYLPENFLMMHEEGLLNPDILSAQTHERAELFAQNKIAFVSGTMPAISIHELNEDIEVGVMPLPAIHEGGPMSWVGGERHTFAISKDTQYVDEAKRFIDFLAQPEIAKQLAEGMDLPAGLSTVTPDIYFQEDYDQFADVMVEPYFDRVFLPGGMWDVYGTTAQELISGLLDPEGVSETMEKEYTRLLENE